MEKDREFMILINNINKGYMLGEEKEIGRASCRERVSSPV